MSPEVSG